MTQNAAEKNLRTTIHSDGIQVRYRKTNSAEIVLEKKEDIYYDEKPRTHIQRPLHRDADQPAAICRAGNWYGIEPHMHKDDDLSDMIRSDGLCQNDPKRFISSEEWDKFLNPMTQRKWRDFFTKR